MPWVTRREYDLRPERAPELLKWRHGGNLIKTGDIVISGALSGREFVLVLFPRASACSLSPGLDSVGPLGREA
jgi:hypothetical protein